MSKYKSHKTVKQIKTFFNILSKYIYVYIAHYKQGMAHELKQPEWILILH